MRKVSLRNRISVVTLFLAVVFGTGRIFTQGGTWSTKAPMPTARGQHAVAAGGGLVYAVGGDLNGGGGNVLSTLEAYDPVSDSWTTKTPMPASRYYLAAAMLDGVLYAVGGHSGSGPLAKVEAYDPLTDTWASKAPLPSARFHLAVGVINGILYAVGGNNGTTGWVSTVHAYNPATNTWTARASMPTARGGLAVAVVNGILYAVGGYNGGSCCNLATVEAYDPVSNTWTTKTPMPSARTSPAAAVLDGKLYALAGGNSSGLLATVDSYDPATDSWSAAPSMSTSRAYFGADALDGVIYAVGGHGQTGALATNEAFALAPAADTVPPDLALPNEQTFEATSSAGALVTYTASALDDVDGVMAPECNPESGTTFPLGTTEVQCTATDSSGNSSTGHFYVFVQDTTPPVLTLPPDIATFATSASGAIVSFTASASDLVDGARPVSCVPVSGSTFAIGTTAVNCTSTDTRLNPGSGSFAVTVNPHPLLVVNSVADAVDASPGNGICATATGVCTLRAAVQEANALVGSDTILFDSSLNGTPITLTILGAGENAAASGDLDITDKVGALRITGNGADNTIIQACDVTANPSCTGVDRLVDILDGVNLNLNGATLTKGHTSEARAGAAIRVGLLLPWESGYGGQASVVVSDSSLLDNTSNGHGGAIHSLGNVTLNSSVVAGNRTLNGHSGGAIMNNLGGTLTITNSTISGNMTALGGSGAAIFSNSGSAVSNVTVMGSTISGNTAGWDAGGIYNNVSAQGTLTISNSTVSGNTATNRGGAIFNGNGVVRLASVTISGNSAGNVGGGILSTSGWSAPVDFQNSIIANNTGGNCLAEGAAKITSQGYNVVDDASCGPAATGDVVGDPLLRALADNGGSTKTHSLRPGSPAIDAGRPEGCIDVGGATLLYDQRGAGFPRAIDANGDGIVRCDSGAFEVLDATPPVLSLPDDITTEAASPDGVVVTFSATATDAVDGPTITTCAPASGSLFAIGSTVVNCSSADASENTAAGSFTVTITRVPTTLVVTPATGTYGGTTTLDATLSASGSPLAGQGINFTLNGALVGTGTTDANGVATLSAVPLAGINASAYEGAIAASFSGDATYAGTNGAADLTVNKRAVTVMADAQSKTYGDADPALTYQITSGALAFADAFTGGLTRAAGENIGPYAIGQGTLALSDNYTLTFVGANLEIGKRGVTVTAEAKSKTYGDTDPALTSQVTTGSLGYNDTFGGALTRVAGEDVGTYAIQQGSLVLSGNYSLTFVGADLVIGKRAVTVTAEVKSKTYGDADPALTYQVTTGSLGYSDTFTGALTRPAGDDIGTYAIQQGSLALSGNYALTFVGADLVIGKRAVTVTADAKSKTYGEADPALTYQVTSGSLGYSDVFTGALTRVTGEDVGTYAIQQGSLALNANYAITVVEGTLTVNAAALTITANSRTKTHGESVTFAGTEFVSSGLVNGNTITSVTLASAGAAPTASAAGSPYAIVPSAAQGSGLTNYTITYLNGALTVVRAATTTTVASSVNPARPTDALSFTATIAILAPGGGVPGGSVEFLDGTTVIGTSPVTTAGGAYVATLPITLGGGDHAITARYLGTVDHQASASAGITQTVFGPPAQPGPPADPGPPDNRPGNGPPAGRGGGSTR